MGTGLLMRRTLLPLLQLLSAFWAASAAAQTAQLGMERVNRLDKSAFMALFGSIFEGSPWVAEAAWDRRPFASVQVLHDDMVAVVRHAPLQAQLALLNSHPDLVVRLADMRGIATSSQAEQTRAGIADLPLASRVAMGSNIAAYRQQFGFPFIIAVGLYTRDGIVSELERRSRNDTQTEFANALENVFIITRLRLGKILRSQP